MKHVRYLRYIAIHKFYVMLACFKRGLIWQGLVHDWSKFLPSEWMPYSEFFYGFKPEPALLEFAKRNGFPFPEAVKVRDAFNVAWLKHQHRSPHHYQFWILRNDDGTTVALEMPRRYVLEMISDWDGAGRAITGKHGGTSEWYLKNRDKMILHASTRALVEYYLVKPFRNPELKYDELVPN